MDDIGSVRLNDPNRVIEIAKQEAMDLNTYVEELKYNSTFFPQIEQLLVQAEQKTRQQIIQLQELLDEVAKEDDPEKKQNAEKVIRNQIEMLEQQEYMLRNKADNLEEAKQGYRYIINESTTLSENGKDLANSIELVIRSIMDTY